MEEGVEGGVELVTGTDIDFFVEIIKHPKVIGDGDVLAFSDSGENSIATLDSFGQQGNGNTALLANLT